MTLNIKVGTLLELRDKQTIAEASKEAGKLVRGKTFEVVELTTLLEQNGSCKFLLAKLNAENLYVLVKVASDGEWYAIGCFVPENMQGSRSELINNGFEFLFDGNEYAKDFNSPNGLYCRVSDPVYGEVNNKEQMFGLCHYRCKAECDNPEAILLECGQLQEEGGGYVMLLQGVIFSDNELEIL